MTRLSRLLEGAGIEAPVTWFTRRAEIVPDLLNIRVPANVDIVHANSWNALAFGKRKAPCVITVHHCVHDPSFAPYKTLAQRLYHRYRIRSFERRSLDGAAAVAAVSEFTRQSVVREFGARQIEVIQNWVDIETFRPLTGTRLPRPFRLLFTGNWGPRKGTDLLPGLMRLLGPGFELFYTTGRRGKQAPQHLPESMRWAGPVPDEEGMVRLYQSCDAVVVPSRLEGFGYAALEAMACGKPVIAFNVAALPEVVADGVTGKLVKLDDVAGMAAACQELADDLTLVRRMGEAARERAVREFSGARSLERYLAIYEAALASGR